MFRRWSLRVLASMPLLAFYLDMSWRSMPWWYREWWGPWLMLGLLLCAAPATFLYYDHLRRSALRLPRPGLALLAAATGEAWPNKTSEQKLVAMVKSQRSMVVYWKVRE